MSEEERERSPGLRHETVLQILKTKRAYPEEVVALCTELLELRDLHNQSTITKASKGQTIYVPDFEEVKQQYIGFNTSQKTNIRQIADQLDTGFAWFETYPGDIYWRFLVDGIMRTYLQR